MFKTISFITAIVFLLIGILGYVPSFISNGLLLGVFQIESFHNIIHLFSGVVAVIAGFAGTYYARLYFKIFGVIYALVTVLGFLTGSAFGIGFIPVNMADNLLHLVFSVVFLYFGFAVVLAKTEEK